MPTTSNQAPSYRMRSIVSLQNIFVETIKTSVFGFHPTTVRTLVNMTTTESTDNVVLFPPSINDVPVESIEVSHSGPACCHNLDDPSCDCDDYDMTSVDTNNNSSSQSSPALSKFWERYDAHDWSNVTSSNEKLIAAITTFVAAAKDVIKFPDCQDVRRILVPLFMTKASEANTDPRSIARAVIETYGLKNSEANSSSLSISSDIILVEKQKKGRPGPKKEKKEKKGKGAKLRNFTKEEDLFLSRAYVRISLDPIRGNDQKSQDFWAHVFRTFVTLYKAEAEVQEDMTDRTVDSVKTRFQRNIQKDVIEFCAICTTELMRSGESQEDFFGRMDLIFVQRKNKPFRFRHCLPVLREIPKFDWENKGNTNADDVADDFLNNSVVEVLNDQHTPDQQKCNRKSSFMNNASTLSRPQGTKAAKRKVVEEYLDGKADEKKMRILQDVATGLSDMAVAIQRKQQRDHLQAMLMIYQSLGNDTQVRNYLKMLEALTAETFPVLDGGNVDGGGNPNAVVHDVEVLNAIDTSPSSTSPLTTLQSGDGDSGPSPSTSPNGGVVFDTHSVTADDDIARELDDELQKIIRDSNNRL